MTPVFVTSCARDPLRAGYAQAVLAYWRDHRHATVTLIDAGVCDKALAQWAAWGLDAIERIVIPNAGSQRERHATAVRIARERGHAWCVQTDDDIMPVPAFDLHHAIGLAEIARTETARFGLPKDRPFGMVSLALPDCHLNHILDPEAVPAFAQRPVQEAGAVGGCRILATAIDFDRMPPAERFGYDCPMADGLRAQGFAVGYFTEQAPKWCRAINLSGPISYCWPYLFKPDTFPRPA